MLTKDFLLQLPEKVNTAALENLSTCFHFDLTGEDHGQVTVLVKDGEMTTREGLHGEPSCTVRAQGSDLKDVFKGKLNPMLAILTGKLKISNQTELLKFAKLLGWM
jgi:putative sterol carrier protein